MEIPDFVLRSWNHTMRHSEKENRFSFLNSPNASWFKVLRSSPRTLIVPASGSSNRTIHFIRTDFPEPDFPSTTRFSPLKSLSDTSTSTSSVPNPFLRLLISITCSGLSVLAGATADCLCGLHIISVICTAIKSTIITSNDDNTTAEFAAIPTLSVPRPAVYPL